VNTLAVFGHYIDINDISRAVEDGSTVPIYHESLRVRLAHEYRLRVPLQDVEPVSNALSMAIQSDLSQQLSMILGSPRTAETRCSCC